MNGYYPSFSPSIPLQQRIAAMEQMQMQSPYGQMYAGMNNPYAMQNPPQYNQSVMNVPASTGGLQGEVVSDYETVKAMKANLDGSTSYYPSTDGKVIYSKSLNPDGTSNIITYEIKDPSNNAPSAPPSGADDETKQYLNRIEEYFKTTNEKIDELFNVFIGTDQKSEQKTDQSKRGGK